MAMKSRSSVSAFCVAVWLIVSIISLLFVSNLLLVNSGSSSALCMPGLSIRCEPDECGSQYVRCGKNQKRQEVPADKVCYKGALIPINSRMHGSGLLPHDCRERTSRARNSTTAFDLKSCNCELCSGTSKCVCYCNSGRSAQTTCSSNGKTYANPEQARCCVPGCKLVKGAAAELDVSSSTSFYRLMWTETLDFGWVVVSSIFQRISDSLLDRFTFPPTLEADTCCSSTKSICRVC